MKERFEALPYSDQQAILDKHRYNEVEDNDWGECEEDDFREDMKEFGIRVDKVYYDISYCQGAGAMFEGKVNDWPKFLAHIKAPECFNHEDVYNTISCEVKHSGWYSHSLSTNYSHEMDLGNSYEKGSIRWHAMEALIVECEANYDSFQTQCEECFKGHMDDLYKTLEKQYEYLTSDEYVLERLIETEQLEEELQEYEDEEENV